MTPFSPPPPFCFSDRSCTVLNVEGDAFGAGLLQVYTERTAGKMEVADLMAIKTDGPDAGREAAEGSPLIKKDASLILEGVSSCEKESVM